MKKLIRDGIALAYEEAGSGLPPMLLVHCWCCDHGYMTPQFEHFGRGHRVISVDLRGHGESDKPRQEYTPAGFADDLAWLCGQIRVDKPVVVGHSMGGNVAFVSTNMRTAASTAKQHTKTMTPTIRFFFRS